MGAKTALKEQKIADFLKKSWAIDGSVDIMGVSKTIINGTEYESASYQLTDSKRGSFLVSVSKLPFKINTK